MNYQYPLSADWSTSEIIDVIQFLQTIEKAYEKGVTKAELMNSYRKFKKIVPGKAEETKYGKEFEQASGYSIYKTLQLAKDAEENQLIKVKAHS